MSEENINLLKILSVILIVSWVVYKFTMVPLKFIMLFLIFSLSGMGLYILFRKED